MRIVDLFRSEEAQDIAEYAVMLAVILVIVVGTIRLIGSNSNSLFSGGQRNSVTGGMAVLVALGFAF